MPPLDIEQPDALRSYLRDTGRIGRAETVAIRVLPGGVSNRVVLVERANGDRWVLKQALSKLRVDVEWYSRPERLRQEALGLRWLEALAPPGTITSLAFDDGERGVLAMAAVPDPHENWKARLLDGRLTGDHVHQFAALIATVHRQASERRAEVEPVFQDRSFFESLRVEPYYRYSATRVPESGSFLAALVDDTRASCLSLVHGDFSPKNVLVHEDRLILLDHEVIHFGDPAFDVGFALTHLLSKAHHLPPMRTAFAGAAQSFWEAYSETLGGVPWRGALEPRVVRHTLGCLLARVAGRSPLEYLDADERRRQRTAAIALMQRPPGTIGGLIESFVEALAREH